MKQAAAHREVNLLVLRIVECSAQVLLTAHKEQLEAHKRKAQEQAMLQDLLDQAVTTQQEHHSLKVAADLLIELYSLQRDKVQTALLLQEQVVQEVRLDQQVVLLPQQDLLLQTVHLDAVQEEALDLEEVAIIFKMIFWLVS